MRKMIILLLTCLFFYSDNIYATGGGLRGKSIKTCPNGITYGMHSDGNGGTHWHVAITNGKMYYADGEAIYYDPCPDYKKNEGTAGHTGDSTNNSQQVQNEPISEPQPTYNEPVAETAPIVVPVVTEQPIEEQPQEVVKEASEEIVITEKEENQVEDNKTKTNKKQETKKITAEKDFKSFAINDDSIQFNSNNKAETTKLYWEKKVKIKYELNDSNSVLKIYKNNKEIKDLNHIKIDVGKNIFTIKIIDKNNKEKIYTLTITRQTEIESIITIILSLGIIGGLIYGIFIIVKKIRNLNKK